MKKRNYRAQKVNEIRWEEVADRLHNSTRPCRRCQRHQPTDMMGHQHVGVYCDSVFSGGIVQALQLEPAILVCVERGLATIAPAG